MNEVTHALSLTRPWPFAITDCGKRTENRNWPIPRKWMGKRVALHAAQSWDEDDREFIQSLGFTVPTKAESRGLKSSLVSMGRMPVEKLGRNV